MPLLLYHRHTLIEVKLIISDQFCNFTKYAGDDLKYGVGVIIVHFCTTFSQVITILIVDSLRMSVMLSIHHLVTLVETMALWINEC